MTNRGWGKICPRSWYSQRVYKIRPSFYTLHTYYFADAHIAIALAMTDDRDGLAALRSGAKGPAGDGVIALADAFAAFAQHDFAATLRALEPLLASHERLGGSRAQRDLIEQLAQTAIVRGALRSRWRPRGTRKLAA